MANPTLRVTRPMSAKLSCELLAEAMDNLAATRTVLSAALNTLPDGEQTLRVTIQNTLEGIDSTRWKVLTAIVCGDEDTPVS